MRPMPRAGLSVWLRVGLGRERLRVGGIKVLDRPGVRPGTAKRLRRLRRAADGRQIFVAADPRRDAGGREIMVIAPRRAPIGAHDDAGLVVIEPQHRAMLALFEIARGITGRKIGRTRGAAAGDAET